MDNMISSIGMAAGRYVKWSKFTIFFKDTHHLPHLNFSERT